MYKFAAPKRQLSFSLHTRSYGLIPSAMCHDTHEFSNSVVIRARLSFLEETIRKFPLVQQQGKLFSVENGRNYALGWDLSTFIEPTGDNPPRISSTPYAT